MKVCTRCKLDRPDSEFNFERRRNRLKPHCKPCLAEKARAWRKSKPGYESARYQQTKQETRERHLVRKYGVSLADYERRLAAQNGACAICCEPADVLHVDHCHATGRVRGLLCRGCNHVLGTVKDDPETLRRAIAYLGVPQVAAEFIAAFAEAA